MDIHHLFSRYVAIQAQLLLIVSTDWLNMEHLQIQPFLVIRLISLINTLRILSVNPKNRAVDR